MRVVIVWFVSLLLVTQCVADVNIASTSRVLPTAQAVGSRIGSVLLAQPPFISNAARAMSELISTKLGLNGDIAWCAVAIVILALGLVYPIYHHIKIQGGPTKHSISMVLLFVAVCVVTLTVQDAFLVALSALVVANVYAWQALMQLKSLKRIKPTLFNVDAPGTGHVIAQYLATPNCDIDPLHFSMALESAKTNKAQMNQDEHPMPYSVTKLQQLQRLHSQPNIVTDILHLIRERSGGDKSKLTLLGIASVLFDSRDPKCVDHASTFMRNAIAYVSQHPDKQGPSSCLSPPALVPAARAENSDDDD